MKQGRPLLCVRDARRASVRETVVRRRRAVVHEAVRSLERRLDDSQVDAIKARVGVEVFDEQPQQPGALEGHPAEDGGEEPLVAFVLRVE